MLSPSMYSPPQSLYHSMQIFHCWKQCCRSSSDSFFMSSIAFAFIASMYSNLLLSTQTWSLEIKKSHMGLGQASTVDVPTRWSCASSKSLDRQGVVCQHVLVKNPWAILPHFRSSSHPFTKVCQNVIVVDLVNGLTFRYPTHMSNPLDVGKKRSSLL